MATNPQRNYGVMGECSSIWIRVIFLLLFLLLWVVLHEKRKTLTLFLPFFLLILFLGDGKRPYRSDQPRSSPTVVERAPLLRAHTRYIQNRVYPRDGRHTKFGVFFPEKPTSLQYSSLAFSMAISNATPVVVSAEQWLDSFIRVCWVDGRLPSRWYPI